jgi:MFS family permease
MRVLFLAAAAAALGASGPILAVLPRGRATLVAGGKGAARGGARALLTNEFALGVLLVFAVTGCFAGTYETCWTLLLRLRHAADYQVGLSWTLFALPFALLSVPAGRLATRSDRRLLAVIAIVWSAGFCAAYPLLSRVWLLVGLGCLEAAGAVVGTPPALLVLTECVAPEHQGEAQGAIETARTAATALAAALAGALFALSPELPFALAAGVGIVGAALVLVLWRRLPRPSARPAMSPLLAAEQGSGAPELPARGAPPLGS